MPTALELLRVPCRAPCKGVSVLPRTRGELLDLVVHAESWYPRYHYGLSERSVQDGRFKYVRAPRPELYDLGDPCEARALSQDHASRPRTLVRALDDLEWRTTCASAATGPQPVDAETEERLAAPGYVGGSVSLTNLEDRPQGDPKDKIGLHHLVNRACASSIERPTDEASARVQQVLAEDSEIVTNL